MNSFKQGPYQTTGWRGYTMDELRYRRAYVTARLELDKAHILSQIDSLRSKRGTGGGGLSIGNAVKYVQYGIMAFQVVRRITSMFRKR